MASTRRKPLSGSHTGPGATVWREGHEAVAATLVVRYLGQVYPQIGHSSVPGRRPTPDPTRCRRSNRRPLPDDPGPAPRTSSICQFTPDRVGLWTYWSTAGVIRSPPGATRSPPKLDAGQGEQDLGNDLVVGAALLEWPPPGCRAPIAARCWPPPRRCAGTATPSTAPRSLSPHHLTEVLDCYPLRDLVTRGQQYGIFRWTAAAAGSAWYEFFPAPPAVWTPAVTLHGTSSRRRALPRSRDGFQCVMVTPADPPDRDVHRKGRNNSVTAEPGDVGSPWAIGSADGARRRSPGPWAPSRISTPSSLRRATTEWRWPRPGAACAPDHPWAASTGGGSRTARRHHRLRREPAEEVPGRIR